MALDADANCINELYKKAKAGGQNILPLVVNLMAPSPAIGWINRERDSITDRLKADVVLALALIHHLAIANNVPLSLIADWLQPMANYLLIEFIPKEDEKVKLLLQNREDIFTDYSAAEFERVFSTRFEILSSEKITGTERVLYLLKKL